MGCGGCIVGRPRTGESATPVCLRIPGTLEHDASFAHCTLAVEIGSVFKSGMSSPHEDVRVKHRKVSQD